MAIKQRTLYGGKINMEFVEERHMYRVNGRTGILSATAVTGTINKPALLYWAVKMMKESLMEFLSQHKKYSDDQLMIAIDEASKAHTKKKEAEATSGSLVHKFAEDYINYQLKVIKEKPEIPKDERVANGALAFLRWVDEHKVKFIASELLVYSKKHDYAGLMDCKFTMGSEKHQVAHCGDFKTSSGVWDEYLFQVAGYQEADAEESKEEYGDAYILRLDKDTGEFEAHVIPAEDHKKNFSAFYGVLLTKRRLKELEEAKKAWLK